MNIFSIVFMFILAVRLHNSRRTFGDYLKRTVTCVSTDAFCTGMWIGIFLCPFRFLFYFFTATRSLALRERGL